MSDEQWAAFGRWFAYGVSDGDWANDYLTYLPDLFHIVVMAIVRAF